MIERKVLVTTKGKTRTYATIQYKDTPLQPADTKFRTVREAKAFLSGLESGISDDIDYIHFNKR